MIKVGIVGGTGYTGVELIRLLSRHPQAQVTMLTSRSEAGRRVDDMFPSLRGVTDLTFSDLDEKKLAACDVVFFATPHGVAMKHARFLTENGTKVIDLAADFRLQSLQDFETWSNYQKINLVYSVRTAAELAYVDRIQEIAETFGEGHSGFKFIPIITRDPSAPLHERLPVLIENGELEKAAGLELSPASSHVMLCGNPQMVDDTKEALKCRGLTMNRRGEGNIAVENYW